jgi:hypothetical protein
MDATIRSRLLLLADRWLLTLEKDAAAEKIDYSDGDQTYRFSRSRQELLVSLITLLECLQLHP